MLTEYYQDTEGNRTPLPSGNIDTGMGLERTAAIMQGVTNVYETDGFQAIMGKVSGVTGRTYGSDKETDGAMRVLAEHARGTTFLISDGVVPANEGRGYVLRRILRRAVTFAREARGSGAGAGDYSRDGYREYGERRTRTWRGIGSSS